jgi:hypothetical protein
MIRKFNTGVQKSSTQRLNDILFELRKLREKLEETESEPNGLVNFAHENHLVTIFNNDVEVIQKHLRRLYYTKK